MAKKKKASDPYAGTALAGLVTPGIQSIVDDLVNAAVSPQQAAIERAQQQALAMAQANAQGTRAAYGAAAELSQGIAPAIEQTYGQASERQAGFAKGYSDTFRRLQNESAGSANEFLAKQGSPQQVAGDQGGADVLYGLGGSLPAQTFNREGAAFTAAAQMLPYSTTQLGLGQANQFLREGQSQAQQFGQQLLDLEAQRPGLRADALQQLVGLALQGRAQSVNEAYLANALRESGAEITGFDPATGEPTLTAREEAKRRREARKERHRGAVSNREDAFQDARKVSLDMAQQFASRTRVGQVPNPEYDPAQAQALGALYDVPKVIEGEVGDPMRFGEAFQRIYNAVATDLKRRYGLKDSRIRQMIREALRAAGITQQKAKRRGRPGTFAETPRDARGD